MTMDERLSHLEEQVAALSILALADTPGLDGYYASRYSGEQIDNLLSGLGFEIGGSYANLAAIQAAFPNGDTHAYQAKDTMDIYVWNAKTRAWESVGKLQGAVGPKGDKGDPGGPPGPQGERGPGSNPNLLDNWYFVDPINQRGLNEYGKFSYTVDRWYLMDGSLSVTGAGLKFHSGNKWFIQYIENFSLLYNNIVTISCLTNDGKLLTATGIVPSGIEGAFPVVSGNYDVEPLTIQLGKNVVDQHIGFRIISLAPNSPEVTVMAAKLELGTEQTLAHQDVDGNWVLNDPPPNKALELMKCQRYYLGLKRWEFWPVLDIQPNYIDFDIPIPVEMRNHPAITNLVSNWLDSSWSLSTAVNGRSVIRARAYKDNHGLTGPLSPIEAYDFAGLSADL